MKLMKNEVINTCTDLLDNDIWEKMENIIKISSYYNARTELLNMFSDLLFFKINTKISFLGVRSS